MVMMPVKRSDVRKMTTREALSILLEAGYAHKVGAGCGDGHRVPVGEERWKLEVAIAKVYKRVYGYDLPDGLYGVYFTKNEKAGGK